MNFNSLEFLIFFAVVLFLYWILPHKVRWILLLVASYYFYMSWNVYLIFLILATTLISFFAALIIERAKSNVTKKFWLIVTLVVCLGVLVFFKYFNFLSESVVTLLRLFTLKVDSFTLDLLLPVGISFYTFQTLSYVVDVYRGDVAAEKHFGYYALYVSYFPQLVAGPIERYDSLMPQLKEKHKFNADDMAEGFRVALGGFFMKCVVADFCGIYVNNVFFNLKNANSLAILLAGALFCVQMYGDFAGYSAIATGVARMMGVKLMRNFDRPYLSQSYTEFFRRWHISLNRWFTDYVYIPLGGSRKGICRKIFNTFVVFVLCGLWHGANWTYVIWGLYAAFFVGLESLLRKPFKTFCDKKNIDLANEGIVLLRRCIMFLVFIPAAWIFRSMSVGELGTLLHAFFTNMGWGRAYVADAFDALSMNVGALVQVLLSIVTLTLLYRLTRYKDQSVTCQTLGELQSDCMYGGRVSAYIYGVIAVALGWIALLATQDASAFAYFQF